MLRSSEMPFKGFPGGSSGKVPTRQSRRYKRHQVQSLGWKDPLQESIAIHSSILAWRMPWTEEPGGHSPWGYKESDTTDSIRASKRVMSV